MSDSTKAQACLQRIVSLFQSGNVPKALAVAVIPPRDDIPSSKWSLSNRLLQFMSDTSDARGFRQWQEADRQVKKGSKCFHILGPKVKKVEKTEDDGEKSEHFAVIGFFSIPVLYVFSKNETNLPFS